MIPAAEELMKALAKLPGLGRRSAARAALALMREPELLADPLIYSLTRARENVCCCEKCGAFTERESNPCGICTDVTRDGRIICVVEDAADVVAIEGTGAFHGKYHVLGGKLSPMHRMGPDKLRFDELRSRVVNEGVEELLLALSTDMEGDATAGYIREMMSGMKVTRLAFGLPADSGVGYSDPLTLRRAIGNRFEV